MRNIRPIKQTRHLRFICAEEEYQDGGVGSTGYYENSALVLHPEYLKQ